MISAAVATATDQSAVLRRMQSSLAVHFDPRWGSPFWIEQTQRFIVSPDDIRTLDDLAVFGPMDEEAMRTRPLDDFIPRSIRESGVRLIPSETGATTGAPKMVVFTEEEFRAGFVDPFVSIADRMGFPRGGRWLFIGPTGPHIIGRAARHLARAMDADEPFNVDFDPRWHRRLAQGSLAQRRHLDHIVEQALHILSRIEVTSLFVTPSALRAILPHMSTSQRLAVRGVHLGGQSVSVADLAALGQDLPNAVIIGGYGNSLVGVCNEVPNANPGSISHHPAPPRHVVRILANPEASLVREVGIGERGRVMFHRFDESFLILNMIERDEATRLPASREAEDLGLSAEGIGDPGPVQTGQGRASEGIY